MVKFFTILFWFAVFLGALGVFLNTDVGDETLSKIVRYVQIEPEPETSSSAIEGRRMFEDRVNQLNEFSGLRSKLLHDRLALLKASEESRRNLASGAMAYLRDYPSNVPAGKEKLGGLQAAVNALNGSNAGLREANDVLSKVRDLEKERLGISMDPAQAAYDRHVTAVSQMEQLARRYKTMTDDLAYQKGMLDSVASRAKDSNEKLRNLSQLFAANEQGTYSMAQRLAAQTETMQNRLAAQMERMAAMQERSSLQMERSYAQLERMYERMEMMRDRMESQNSRLQAMLERSAAQNERLQAMQERTSNIQQRMSNLGSH